MPGWTDYSLNTIASSGCPPATVLGYDLLNDFMIPQGISHNKKKILPPFSFFIFIDFLIYV
jgi:hypothetical protein